MTNNFEAMTDQLKSWIGEAREQLKMFGTPIWGATDAALDSEHLQDFELMLTKGRERFDLPAQTRMHSLRLETEGGGSFVACLTGNTPQAGDRARALASFLMSMPLLIDNMEASVVHSAETSARISELIDSNNTKEEANRVQARRIKQLEEQVRWLVEKIGVEYVAPESDAA